MTEDVSSLLEAIRISFEDIIGEGELIKAAIVQAKHAADTPSTVLLRGESGSGKELFAYPPSRQTAQGRMPTKLENNWPAW